MTSIRFCFIKFTTLSIVLFFFAMLLSCNATDRDTTPHIHIFANIKGFRVYLDGDLCDHSTSNQIKISDLSSGKHIITIRKAGYNDYSSSFEISSGQSLDILAVLDRVWKGDGKKDQVHTIITVGNVLVGGKASGKWLSPEAMVPFLTGRETYKLYEKYKYVGTAQSTAIRENELNGLVGTFIQFSKPFPDWSWEAVAVCCNWDAAPKGLIVGDPLDSVYRDSVQAFLMETPLANETFEITQVINVDLDGDKRSETIICAHTTGYKGHIGSTESSFSDLSFSILKKTDNSGNRIIKLGQESYDYSELDCLPIYEIASALDVDGDDRLELLLVYAYWELVRVQLLQGYGSYDILTVSEFGL